jgi:hypothetical protein
MRVKAILFAALLQAALALSPSQKTSPTKGPALSSDRHWKLNNVFGATLGIVALTTSLTAADAIPPPEVIRIQADIPALFQVAKNNKDVLLKVAQESNDAVKISKFPDNLVQFARDAAAGDVLLNVNGIPIDVSLLSEKGGIDINLSTEKGDVSLTLTSPYLPKLPLFSKRIVPLTKEGIAVEEVERLETAKAFVVNEAKDKELKVKDDTPFIYQVSSLDVFNRGWTNQNVIGWTGLPIGTAYVTAYYTYLDEQEKAEQESAAKAKAAAEKRKKDAAVAAAKKKSAAKIKEAEEKETQAKKRFTILTPEEAAVAAILERDEAAVKDLPQEFYVPTSNAFISKKKTRRRWYMLWLV